MKSKIIGKKLQVSKKDSSKKFWIINLVFPYNDMKNGFYCKTCFLNENSEIANVINKYDAIVECDFDFNGNLTNLKYIQSGYQTSCKAVRYKAY